jgi:hypothetical protein
MNDPERMKAYRECLKEHAALKKIAQVIVEYLPGDFSLTREEAMSEIIGILEQTPIFDEISASRSAISERQEPTRL